MPVYRTKGISEVVSAALLASITIALGLMIWGLSASWSFISSLEFLKETDELIGQVQSLLSVEYSYMNSGTCYLYVRNVGESDVVISRIVVSSESSGIILDKWYDGFDPPERESLRIGVGDVKLVRISGCNPHGDVAVNVKLYYIAERHFDPDNPRLNADRLVSIDHLLAGG